MIYNANPNQVEGETDSNHFLLRHCGMYQFDEENYRFQSHGSCRMNLHTPANIKRVGSRLSGNIILAKTYSMRTPCMSVSCELYCQSWLQFLTFSKKEMSGKGKGVGPILVKNLLN